MRVSLSFPLVACIVGLGISACDGYYMDGGSYDPTPTYPTTPPPPVVNYAPSVGDADAGVYYDDRSGDDVWYFDAYVADPDGLSDVAEVRADVYDVFSDSSEPVESFDLAPASAPGTWSSQWYASSTYLDPYYSGYQVELVALDYLGEEDYVQVTPLTY